MTAPDNAPPGEIVDTAVTAWFTASPRATLMHDLYSMLTLAFPPGDPASFWPWPSEWWKPSEERRRNLVKAGALILTEIERLAPAALSASQQQEG